MSKAEDYIQTKGLDHYASGSDQLVVRPCPLCRDSQGKFFIATSDDKDGLFNTYCCKQKGNLRKLKQLLGDEQYVQQPRGNVKPLPDLDLLHRQLLDDERFADVLDYLVSQRGFSIDTITKLKLGATETDDKLWVVYPYIDAQGRYFNYKARTVPPAKKDFRGAAGREAGLYNLGCLHKDMEYLIIVEGEGDAVSLIDQGIDCVIAVPGAKTRKDAWVDAIDAVAPKKIYLLYDNDKVGQENAKSMAMRLGADKTWNILLPEFSVEGLERPGKDINEYFLAGHDLVALNSLMESARQFEVDGVMELESVGEELIEDIEGRGLNPMFNTPWPSVNELLGGFDEGDLVSVTAEGKVGKTTFCGNWAVYMAQVGWPTFFFCDEMMPKRQLRKFVSHVTKTPDEAGKSQITKEVVQQGLEVMRVYPGKLTFGYSASRDHKKVMETIRQNVRRYGTKVVFYDNLHLLVKGTDNVANEISNITKDFKSLAMQLKILFVLIVQPNRVQEGKIVTTRNAYGSSAIEKDVDVGICLHRNRLIPNLSVQQFHDHLETDQNLDPNLLVNVDLARYAAGGMRTLWMDGATSTVREKTASDAPMLPQTSAITIEQNAAVM